MVLSMERWVGKVAVVTGASSGIGAGIAERLVSEGLKVVGIARRIDRIENRSKELAQQGKKGKLYAVKADLSEEEDILNAFKWVADNLGPVNILVNNAGVHVDNSLSNGETAGWKKVLDLNVLALCICTREAIKSMEANNVSGHIVHINSVTGHKVPNFPRINIYCASKYAVTALTETLRQELNQKQSKIKITSLSPGLVESEMTTLNERISKEKHDFLTAQPIIHPEDIGDGLVYVLSTPPNVQIHELTIAPVGESF